MSRRALITLALALVATGAAGVGAQTDPHLDKTLLPGGCSACHSGHGASSSPMLSRPQSEVCLACHESQGRVDEEVRRGRLAPGASPPLLGSALQQAVVHPLTGAAFSRFEPAAVTCTSCHSPHRRSVALKGSQTAGNPKSSTRNPQRREHELCETCHGNAGPITRDPSDLARLFDASSESFHPVHAPTRERSPSAVAGLRGRMISCTDCHANGDTRGARGPHGSPWSGLLAASYVATDGAGESATTYALCWRCHDREVVLGESSSFPLHRTHVVDEHASCATCHSAHGSIGNRALIHFGEETTVAGVSPSATLGRLQFISHSRGAGSCMLTCHGVDHAAKNYGGAMRLLPELRPAAIAPPRATPGAYGTKPTPSGAARPQGRDSQPPPPR